MPFIFDQKRPLGQLQQPQQQQAKKPPSYPPPPPPSASSSNRRDSQPRNSLRLSAIPRPLSKLTVIETKNVGISHASKPTVDRLPMPTPSKGDLNRTRPVAPNQPDQAQKPKVPTLCSDPELAILELVPFSRQPIVNFGDVKLATTKIRYVLLRNSLDIQQQLFVKSFPKPDKGFYMDATEFLIAPNTEICVALAWTPKTIGGLRESITMQDINRMPKRIVLMGTAIRPKPDPSLTKPTRNIPRLFRKSPVKINKQLRQERNKLVFSPRTSALKPDKNVKPLRKLTSPSPKKRHQLVRKILSQYDDQMATRIQSYIRMVLAKRLLTDHKAAVKIQSYFRMVLAKRDLQRQIATIIKIQAYWRMVIARRHLQRQRAAMTKIQAYCRMIIARRQLKQRQAAIVKIQSLCRMLIAKRQLARRRAALIKIQSFCRMLIAKRIVQQRRLAVVKIQSYCRMVLERRRLAKMHIAATKIQSYYRMVLTRRRLTKQKHAVITIQSFCRMYLARRKLTSQRRAATKIQSYYRMLLQRRQYIVRRAAVIKIQSFSRMFLVKRRLTSQRNAATKIQAYYRMVLKRRQFANQRAAVIKVQSYCRMLLARRDYMERFSEESMAFALLVPSSANNLELLSVRLRRLTLLFNAVRH